MARSKMLCQSDIMKAEIFASYKAFLRQTRKLPTQYLRQFWRLKAFDDVRAILGAQTLHIRQTKLQRMAKDTRRLEAANSHKIHALDHVLKVAYGRKGKLKRELIEPLLSDPNAPLPTPIIPGVEDSRPPIYSPELRALLTSSASRPSAVLRNDALETPPTLPARANPKSEEAKLLGPFSKRREVNIRWRHFVKESRKVKPPLQVTVNDSSGSVKTEATREVGIRSLPMQDWGVFEDIETHATSPHLSRWIRRRFQTLLNDVPVLQYQSNKKYTVALSEQRLSSDQQKKLNVMDDADVKWLER
ncbi:hypothetical protein MIND_00467600 [Mycena indigotica]|uniref:LYR motif-containing protein Cup1-like N-terminal domain-containing protein n=1 Tax=Mycena indigotica TaxID=2126181 RepID=A0A8H6WBW8_9AGAR|nr:uncharacterized protein MIND_00467600 [Mycena indigotica]KAF7306759.1 hypothetical protein MIND_00467600 [Mycena indigotica]